MTRISVILPYFNEARYIGATLASLLAQQRPPNEIVLVDNASTDGSSAACRKELAAAGPTPTEIVWVSEPEPGKIRALAAGLERARGELIATADADTTYPPHYFALVERLAERAGPARVAFLALAAGARPQALAERLRRHARVAQSALFRRQAFTGGFGQTLRAEALRAAGGFDERYWRWVLLDHEVLHRVFRHGRPLYHVDLWCQPSGRRRDRRAVRWSLGERLLYLVWPFALEDWFFYRFLGPRLERRGMSQLRLREKTWREL